MIQIDKCHHFILHLTNLPQADTKCKHFLIDASAVMLVRGELKVRVENIPARICPNCGEAYADEEATAQLLKSAE